MNKPLFDVDRVGMQVSVNAYQPGTGLVWGTMFPVKYTPRFDIKGLEGNEGIPVAADRVAFNSKAPKKTRKTIGSWSGQLAKYAVSREKDEVAINEYNDLTVLAAANSEDAATAKYLVDMVYDDVTFCQKALDYKVECDALRCASWGKLVMSSSIDGDMVNEEVIDFNIPETNKGGVSVVWSDKDNADGIADIAKMQKTVVKAGNSKPMYATMREETFEALISQVKVARRLYPHYNAESLSTAAAAISLTDVNTYMRGHGLPEIIVVDSYVTIEGKDGNQSTFNPWNENAVALSLTSQLGCTWYKTVPMVQQTDALQVQGSYYKITRYSENNPMKEVTLGEAYVQPGLINRASYCLINVNSTKGWNEGAA